MIRPATLDKHFNTPNNLKVLIDASKVFEKVLNRYHLGEENNNMSFTPEVKVTQNENGDRIHTLSLKYCNETIYSRELFKDKVTIKDVTEAFPLHKPIVKGNCIISRSGVFSIGKLLYMALSIGGPLSKLAKIDDEYTIEREFKLVEYKFLRECQSADRRKAIEGRVLIYNMVTGTFYTFKLTLTMGKTLVSEFVMQDFKDKAKLLVIDYDETKKMTDYKVDSSYIDSFMEYTKKFCISPITYMENCGLSEVKGDSFSNGSIAPLVIEHLAYLKETPNKALGVIPRTQFFDTLTSKGRLLLATELILSKEVLGPYNVTSVTSRGRYLEIFLTVAINKETIHNFDLNGLGRDLTITITLGNLSDKKAYSEALEKVIKSVKMAKEDFYDKVIDYKTATNKFLKLVRPAINVLEVIKKELEEIGVDTYYCEKLSRRFELGAEGLDILKDRSCVVDDVRKLFYYMNSVGLKELDVLKHDKHISANIIMMNHLLDINGPTYTKICLERLEEAGVALDNLLALEILKEEGR